MFPELEKHHLVHAQQTQQRLGHRLFAELIPLEATWSRVARPGAFADRPPLADLRPITEGDRWGSGSDHAWFRFRGALPATWLAAGAESVAWIDLGTEGLVFDSAGRITQGISPGRLFENTSWRGTRPVVELAPLLRPGQGDVEFWIQASCHTHPDPDRRLGEPAPHDGPWPLGGCPEGVVRRARIARFDRAVWDLYMDFEVLLDLVGSLPAAAVRRAKLIRHLVSACEHLARAPHDLAAARAALRPAFEKPAGASDLRVHGVGHGHLDSAWLWTLSTGRQKAARTTANQLRLMEQYPEHVFGLSAALHYQWLREDHPQLFEQVRARVAEGRWEIHGAVWVEADAHLPSGESLVRQFLHGDRWFREHLGRGSDFLWLPDVFGYAPTLPGIMRHCGADALVTQKISWGQYHPFPHNAFRWRGLDGSEVIAYFPPENDYSSNLLPSQLRAAQERCAERDRLDDMLSLFGYGDGGGGPHAKHLERARRCRDLEGCPPVRVGGAGAFLDILRARRADLERWDGPFYLENHRGTFTTQAFVKRDNRRLEQALQALEILWSAAPAAEWPAAELDTLWKTALVNQFHDIIPGSSIREVYDTTRADYGAAFAKIAELSRRFATCHLAARPGAFTLFNSLPHAWRDLLRLPAPPAGLALRDADGRPLPAALDATTGELVALVEVPALGFATFTFAPAPESAAVHSRSASVGTIGEDGNIGASSAEFVLENELVRYEFDADGRLVRAFDRERARELVSADEPGNVFSLYADLPTEWDAWNLDLTYERALIATARADTPPRIERDALGSVLHVSLRVGDSAIRQRIRILPGARRLDFDTEIDWHEKQRHLRVSFPVALRGGVGSYEVPFGVVTQPTHRNTSRDLAMFEHCGHRFMDLSEPDYGVALLNDGKYGHKIRGHVLDLALLRAPLWPDPTADRGRHTLRFALLPHPGPLADGEVLTAAANFNRAPHLFADAAPAAAHQAPAPAAHLLDDAVSLEALKRTEDGDAWLVRLVERRGRHARARLRFPGPVELIETDGLERSVLARLRSDAAHEITLPFTPFQIRSWKIVPAA